MVQLEQPLWCRKAAQLEGTEVDELGPARQSVARQVGGGLGHEDLTPVSPGRYPGHLVQGKRHIVVSNGMSLTGVHAHPNPQVDMGRPQVRRQCELTLQACGDGIGRIGERDQQRVPLGTHLHPFPGLDCRPQ